MRAAINRSFIITLILILATLSTAQVHATEPGEIGVVVLHGKWDSPRGWTQNLATYLGREGYKVVSPEMPWSGRRAYDKGTDVMVDEISQAVEDLKKAGAKKIYIIGHSQGAVASIYYAGRQQVNGIVLIAAGGHTQGIKFSENYALSVTEAKNKAAQGQGNEMMSFTDLNTGNRNKIIKSPAQSIIDYFDPKGPFNSELSAAHVKPDTRVLILVPKKEIQPLKDFAPKIARALPKGASTRISEIDAEHLDAPDVSKQLIRDWLMDS